MIRATVQCQRCGRIFAEDRAETFRDAAYAMQAMLLAVHAKTEVDPCENNPDGEASHRYVHHIEGDEQPNGQPFKIECTHAVCKRRPDEQRVLAGHAPLEMIGALALVLHTAHEGHPMRIEWAGRVWSSPER